MTAATFDRRAIPAVARESVWHLPDGQALRRIDWPAPEGARGAILFMCGRGDHYEKYLEALDHWHRLGWAVTAADWRGQAGSGRLGADELTGHIDSFDVWIADLSAFWGGWVTEMPGPHVLMGHSMGGHLVLRAVGDGALVPAPDGLVLSAPMLDMFPDKIPLFIRRAVAWAMCRIGDPRRQAWKWSEKPGEFRRERQLLLTHDAARYEDESWWRQQRPELRMGPGSWGWVSAALQSVARLERAHYLEGVKVPTLLLGTDADKLVSPDAIRHAARRIPGAEIAMYGEETAHEILREVDPVRKRALATIDEFLDRVAAA